MKKESKNKLKNLVSPEKSNWLEKAEFRNDNEEWLQKSSFIALKILRFIRKSKISQKEFARNLGVSPQQVNKILKGNENLTLKTICQIESALGIELISIATNESFTNPKVNSDDFINGSKEISSRSVLFELTPIEHNSCKTYKKTA